METGRQARGIRGRSPRLGRAVPNGPLPLDLGKDMVKMKTNSISHPERVARRRREAFGGGKGAEPP